MAVARRSFCCAPGSGSCGCGAHARPCAAVAGRRVRSVPRVRRALSGDLHEPVRAAAGRAASRTSRPRAALAPRRGRLAARAAHRRVRRARSAAASVAAYARQKAPAFRLLDDMTRAGRGDRRAGPSWRLHRRESSICAGRCSGWAPPCRRFRAISPRRRSTSGSKPVKYWNADGRAPVWFLADPQAHRHRPRRSIADRRSLPMAAAVPRAHRRRAAERVGLVCLRLARLVSRRRLGADAGDGRRGGRGPSRAWPARRSRDGFAAAREAVTLMIGGRNLDPARRPQLPVTIDDGSRISVTVSEVLRPGSSCDSCRCRPARSPEPAVRATRQGRRARDRGRAVAIEQFDAQPAPASSSDSATAGTSWRYNPATGASWRWMSERGEIRLARDRRIARSGSTSRASRR